MNTHAASMLSSSSDGMEEAMDTPNDTTTKRVHDTLQTEVMPYQSR